MSNIYNMSDSWTDSGTIYTSIKMNVTDTASDDDSLLMDLQRNDITKYSVAKDGSIYTANAAQTRTNLGLGTAALSAASDFVLKTGDTLTGALTVSNGTITSSAPILNLSQVWNASGVSFTAIRLSVTNGASALASLLMDLKVDGDGLIKFFKSAGCVQFGSGGSSGWGTTVSGTTVSLGRPSGTGGLDSNTTVASWLSSTNSIAFPGDIAIGTSYASRDLILSRGGSGILEQRNSTTPQTYLIYNTYTNSSNYERGALFWNGTLLTLGTQSLGTGAAKGMSFMINGTEVFKFSTAGHFLAVTNNSYDIGDATHAPRDLRIARNVYMTGLPTSDPHVAGQLWTNSGIMTVSTG